MNETPATRQDALLAKRLGLGAALTTPFGPDGEVLWGKLADHARRLMASGLSIVTTFGTTGEGASLDRATRARAIQRLSELGIAPANVATCIYGPAARDAADDIRRALAEGCAAILLVPPFYYKAVSDDGLFRWHAEVFEAVGAGCREVILYNIPGLTGATIGPELVGRLRRAFPEVVAGVKDSGGDWGHTTTLLAEHRDLAILVGHEGHLARAVQNGASGAISGMANVAPRLVAGLVAGTGNALIDWALERLLAMPIVPAIKAVLAEETGDGTWRPVRAPLEPIDGEPRRLVCAEVAARLADFEGAQP